MRVRSGALWTALLMGPLLVVTGCSGGAQPSSAEPSQVSAPSETPSASELAPPIQDARAFAELLGRIAEADGDPDDLGMGDEPGDFGIRQAWLAAGWPSEGFGPASPTTVDLHPMRGADTVDVPFVAYAVRDTQDRCFLGAVTYSPAGTADGAPSLVSVVIPGLGYRDCTSEDAAQEFAVIVGTMHGDQP